MQLKSVGFKTALAPIDFHCMGKIKDNISS